MKEKLKKKKGIYEAPKMEATSFKVEHGYAGSGPRGTVQQLTDEAVTFGFGS